jgi:SAM-dependent methyltransferase
MKFLGLQTLDLQGDAGIGRVWWLQQRIDPASNVVDLGGEGQLLKPWCQRVTALDDLSGFGPGHRIHADRFIQGDVCDLSCFKDDEFDVAVATEVLEHVPLPWVALREAGRVAKRVLITVPYEGRWQHPIAYKVGGHIRHYVPDLLALHLRMAGLDGEMAFLDFGGWSFIVAEVTRA